MKLYKTLLCLLYIVFFSSDASYVYADRAPEMITDRPDQTESSTTVSPGYVQIETGLLHTKNESAGITEFPGTLFRIGVSARIEARVGFSGWIFDDALDTNGFGDSELAAKIFLWKESGWIPEAAIIAGVSIPTGEEDFSSERADPAVRCAFSHILTDRLSLGYNIAAEWVTDTNKHTQVFMPYTCALGIGVTERIGTYVEFFGEFPLKEDGDAAHLFNCGMTYSAAQNFQLDVEGGVGIAGKADDWFIGTGISYRIPR